MSGDDDKTGINKGDTADAGFGDVNDDKLLKISKEWPRRNLVPCSEEDNQSLKWARTCELA